MAEFKKVIDSIRHNIFWISLCGGEPTLLKELPQYVEYLCRQCPHLSMINIPTNGLKSDRVEKIIEQCIEKLRPGVEFHVTVSIDGFREEQKLSRGFDCYDQSMETFQRLQKLEKKHKNFYTAVQTIITNYNIDTVSEFREHIGHGSSTLCYGVESDFYGNTDKQDEMIVACQKNLEKTVQKVKQIYQGAKIKGANTLFMRIYLKLYLRFLRLDKKKMVIPCTSSFASLTIQADGNVKSCDRSQIFMGNVKDYNYSIPEILESEMAGKVRSIIKNCDQNEDCLPCWVDCEAYPSMFAHPFRTIWYYLTTK